MHHFHSFALFYGCIDIDALWEDSLEKTCWRTAQRNFIAVAVFFYTLIHVIFLSMIASLNAYYSSSLQHNLQFIHTPYLMLVNVILHRSRAFYGWICLKVCLIYCQHVKFKIRDIRMLNYRYICHCKLKSFNTH